VLGVSAALVVATAVAVSASVSDHLTSAAMDQAVRSAQTVMHGYVDPSVSPTTLQGKDPVGAVTINRQLERLTSAGQLLRIKVWSPDGTVTFSDLQALRGRQFEIDHDLAEALEGEVEVEFSTGTAGENEFERGVAAEFLEIYIPIVDNSTGAVMGAYEIYEDAAPIRAAIADSRRDVLLIVGAMAMALLALLFGAFSGASRLLTRQNRRLRSSEERFRSLVRNSVDVHMVVAPDGTILYESPAAQRVLGVASDRVGHQGFDGIHEDDRAYAARLLEEAAAAPDAEVTGEVRALHADGSWRAIEAVLKNRIDDPAVGGIVVNYRDVTARKELEAELRRQAFHDSLTGLANRELFANRLEHALAQSRRFSRPIAVLFLDLDDFKTVNDSLGHGEGDELLIAVARRLEGALRAGDTFARMGGDEFAVLVEDPADAQAAVDIAERLLATLDAPFEHGTKELFVRASIGVAVSPIAGLTAEELLRNADVSMYTAKGRGKNRVKVFEAGMHEAALARLALKGDLERALERGEFILHYQPILDLSTSGLVGFEALIRWQHPGRGLVPPLTFIPVAEETALIVPLGAWVLEQACRTAAGWAAPGGRPLGISINVSGRQLQESGFVATVRGVLAATGLAPERLTLELTESVVMHDAEAAIEILAQLKALGVRLAIDDFGTGYSSLSYLRRFPIDELKIDRSFVASMHEGPEQAAVVLSIIKLSETLRLATVAEGIEDAAQVAELQSLGASLGQGYFFARPLAIDRVEAMIAEAARSRATRHEGAA
jgi:diguanylate cyclase (GGDEF)-like protein/PAS domain S-box-containing protein